MESAGEKRHVAPRRPGVAIRPKGQYLPGRDSYRVPFLERKRKGDLCWRRGWRNSLEKLRVEVRIDQGSGDPLRSLCLFSHLIVEVWNAELK